MTTNERIEAIRTSLVLLAGRAPATFTRIEALINSEAASAPLIASQGAELTAEERSMASAFHGGEEEFRTLKGVALGRIARLQSADRERLTRVHGQNWSAMAAAIDREGLVVG